MFSADPASYHWAVPAPTDKPRLRGWSHVAGALALAAAAPALVARCATSEQARWVGAYLGGVGTMMVVSSLYHRVRWSEAAWRVWRRADLVAIFAAVAGTGVAVAGLTLSPRERLGLIGALAGAALVGWAIARRLGASRWAPASFFLIVGWAPAPFFEAIAAGGGVACAAFVAGGGLAYSVGAVVFARQRPRLAPRVFGFHELFHVLTLVGAGLHYGALWVALSR
jgi:hemolysin III